MSFITAWLVAAAAAGPALAGPQEGRRDNGVYEAAEGRWKASAERDAAFSGTAGFTGWASAFPELKGNGPADVPESVRAPEGRSRPFSPPPGSRAFMPNWQTKAAPGSLYPKDSRVPRERAEQLGQHFKQFYPDVTYHIEWDDETVNAYAWMEGGERHVALLGGLMRHKAIGMEGIALVLAHEVGHHYGGEPTYPGSGLSCEGQADYWGAGVGMRRVWGDQYRDQMLPAISQLNDFFSKGVVEEITPAQQTDRFQASAGCGHPPAACRKATYEAAMRSEPKPSCAGIVPEMAAAPGGGGLVAALR